MKSKIILMLLCSSVLFTSCIGSFSAFNGLREWNQNATNNKFGNEIIFIALWIIPVYQIASLGDLVIFNTIEFWDGKNPLAMSEGESETEIVKGKNSTYAITATKNKFDIKVIDGRHLGVVTKLIYQENDQSWNLVKEDGKKVKLTSLKKGFRMVHLPNGSSFELNKNMNSHVMKNYVSEKIIDYKQCNSLLSTME